MADLGAFKAAVTAWHESKDEASRAEALRLFDTLELGQQEIILYLATVARPNWAHSSMFGRAWQRWYGDNVNTWLTELQQCGLATLPSGFQVLEPPLAELACSIVQDPDSRYYGSRVWVQDGVVLGAQKVSTANRRAAVLTEQPHVVHLACIATLVVLCGQVGLRCRF